MLVAAAHFTDFIAVLVHVIVLDASVLTAVVYIAEAGYIDLTGAVGASCGRLRFCGRSGGLLLVDAT